MAPRAYKSYYRKVFSLEAFRVLFYVAVPVITTAIYTQHDVIKYLLNTWQFVKYSPQDMEAFNKNRLRIEADRKKNEEDLE